VQAVGGRFEGGMNDLAGCLPDHVGASAPGTGTMRDDLFPGLPDELGPLQRDAKCAMETGWPWPVFPGPLERRFEADTDSARSRHLAHAGLVMMCVANGFLFSDWLVMRDVFAASLTLHVVCTLAYTAVLLATVRGGLPAPFREAMHGVMVSGALLGALALFSASASPDSGYNAITYQLFIVAVTVVLRLRFTWAVFFSVFCLLATAAAVMLHSDMHAGVKWLLVLTTMASAVFTLYANYSIEIGQRYAYLLRLERELAAQALQDSNALLSELSATDFLTGAANRRAFEAQLSREWSRAAAGSKEAAGPSLGLIMIDVDHFKSYNDLHGHPAGDACLCSLATAMRKQLRAGQDLLARYGGEEFAVIMPLVELDDAAAAAERLRHAVHDLRIVHGGAAAGPFVTISVGVATATPASAGTREALLEAADRALYKAKNEGRNLVSAA
jgi:diguanylate cyclase (GGDEF)-like protein